MAGRQAKVDHDKYESLEDFVADIKLMVDNARFYNEDGSEVFKDADRIWVRPFVHTNLGKLLQKGATLTSGVCKRAETLLLDSRLSPSLPRFRRRRPRQRRPRRVRRRRQRSPSTGRRPKSRRARTVLPRPPRPTTKSMSTLARTAKAASGSSCWWYGKRLGSMTWSATRLAELLTRTLTVPDSDCIITGRRGGPDVPRVGDPARRSHCRTRCV